ncbi:TetR/AcrR family transcriptional regulator [Streptomyces tagetis]|uniref:TetR/AcrR family transcriptional regulator n=1 Tax=Streptomyces tagetis TaxID=2820809 RepID=A0A941AZZ0_9ACTN|nr:TetR/AcrR family transcriptional regulator [Streptomyces sp. RG38]MBQ0829404.1 TetR/AcrR family transcriptional regulator [Streptomyces sp. RG38]
MPGTAPTPVSRTTSDDPRARRTRARLHAAVLALSTERDPDTITMAEIAERAEVSRATVYLHYKDRDDLLLDAADSAMTDLVEAVRACRGAPGPDPADPAPPGHLVTLFTHVARHRPLYARMLGEDGSARCAARLRSRLAEAWRCDARREQAGPEAAARSHFVGGGLVALIAHWSRGTLPGPATPADLAALAWSLLRAHS